MTQTYKVQVSMNQAHIVESGFVWKQGDFGFNIEIEVLDFDTTGATPQIIFRKSTGAVEATQITRAGNKFTYAIRGTELDTPGPCVCDLKLKDSTTKRVSTASFKYFVIPDTMDGLNQQASSYSDTIAQIVEGYEDDVEDLRYTMDDTSIKMNTINGTVYINPTNWENGSIDVAEGEATYTNNKFYARTKENFFYNLASGNKITVTQGINLQFQVIKETSGVYSVVRGFGTGDYTITNNGNYAIVIRFWPVQQMTNPMSSYVRYLLINTYDGLENDFLQLEDHVDDLEDSIESNVIELGKAINTVGSRIKPLAGLSYINYLDWENGSIDVSEGSATYTDNNNFVRPKQNVFYHLLAGEYVYIDSSADMRFSVIKKNSQNVYTVEKAMGTLTYIVQEEGDYAFTMRYSTLQRITDIREAVTHLVIESKSNIIDNVSILKNKVDNQIYDHQIIGFVKGGLSATGTSGEPYNYNVTENTNLRNARSGYIKVTNDTCITIKQGYTATVFLFNNYGCMRYVNDVSGTHFLFADLFSAYDYTAESTPYIRIVVVATSEIFDLNVDFANIKYDFIPNYSIKGMSEKILTNKIPVNAGEYTASTNCQTIYDKPTGMCYTIYQADKGHYGERQDNAVVSIYPVLKPWELEVVRVAWHGMTLSGHIIRLPWELNIIDEGTGYLLCYIKDGYNTSLWEADGTYYIRKLKKSDHSLTDTMDVMQLSFDNGETYNDFSDTGLSAYIESIGGTPASQSGTRPPFYSFVSSIVKKNDVYYSTIGSSGGNPLAVHSADGINWIVDGMIPSTCQFECMMGIVGNTCYYLCRESNALYSSDDYGQTFTFERAIPNMSLSRPQVLGYRGHLLLGYNVIGYNPNHIARIERCRWVMELDGVKKVDIESKYGIIYPSVFEVGEGDLYMNFNSGVLYNDYDDSNSSRDAIFMVKIGVIRENLPYEIEY